MNQCEEKLSQFHVPIKHQIICGGSSFMLSLKITWHGFNKKFTNAFIRKSYYLWGGNAHEASKGKIHVLQVAHPAHIVSLMGFFFTLHRRIESWNSR
jgi:hypothetical protein